ncbi:MAG: response regulator [Desulfobulbaceae bacterium]|nr:response regulator [Desulfobulbaceae bacterium]
MPPQFRERSATPYQVIATFNDITDLIRLRESHKGAITVDSRPGTGTTFSLYLPELVIVVQQAAEDNEEALPGGSETILVVDDEPAVATIMQRLLNHLGYTVEAFTDSARALEAYTKEPEAFDLVITDMTMPKLTGLAIARAMLALRPQQPIILYTGFSEAVDEEIASAEGIKALLAKPISQETLAHTVRRTLDLDKAQVSPAA